MPIGHAGQWPVASRTGLAADLHGRALDASGRSVEVLVASSPTLVLGSTQPEADVDAKRAAARGVQVARRRSGGGAVLLLPGEATWVDVTIARSDPLWDDDVARAFHWLGRAWVGAVRSFGIDADVHEGPLVTSSWSRRVCFAGLGAGEVTTGSRKLVGVSQRRTRDAARFQCCVLRWWDPAPVLDLLALGDDERARGRAELADVATGLDESGDAVVAALVAHLPG